MKSLRWAAAGVGVIGVAATLLSGCGDVQKALNKGGDTSCSDYLKQDQDTRRVTITKFVKQQSGDEHEPAGTIVDAAILQVNLLCGGQRDASTPIKKADLAGIVFNK